MTICYLRAKELAKSYKRSQDFWILEKEFASCLNMFSC